MNWHIGYSKAGTLTVAKTGEVPDPIMTLTQAELERLYQLIGFELRRQKLADKPPDPQPEARE